MVLQIKDFITSEVLFEYSLIRVAMNDTYISCMLNAGFQESTPEKNKVYKLHIQDTDTNTSVQKVVLFSSYAFLMDKDGSNPATITDNSLVFQVMA